MLDAHREEFALDVRSGWLAQRLARLAPLGRHAAVMRIIERHPEAADLFANAAEPEALARLVRDLTVDAQEEARLLNLFVSAPSRSEIGHLQRVLERHGPTVMIFASSPRLHAVSEALVLSHAEGAPRVWTDWMAAELRTHARDEKLDEVLALVATHGRILAVRIVEDEGFAWDFPDLWARVLMLLDAQPDAEARRQMFTGLLSHRQIWDTLRAPHGTAALRAADDPAVLLISLWGTEGWTRPAEAVGPLLEHADTMPPERRTWLLRALGQGDAPTRDLGRAAMVLRDADGFWSIALDPERVDLLGCAVARAIQDWDGEGLEAAAILERMAALPAPGLRRTCEAAPPLLVRALPGYLPVWLVGDLIFGAPVNAWDVAAAGSDIYLPARYAAMLLRGARASGPGLRLGPRMTLDHLRTLRMELRPGNATAVMPRPLDNRPRDFVLVQDGWLAPVPREILKHGGLFLTRETLMNLAAEALTSPEMRTRIIVHFRCAGRALGMEDPRCL